MNVPGLGVLIRIQVSWKLLWGVPILQKPNWNLNFNVREENILERNGLSTKWKKWESESESYDSF